MQLAEEEFWTRTPLISNYQVFHFYLFHSDATNPTEADPVISGQTVDKSAFSS